MTRNLPTRSLVLDSEAVSSLARSNRLVLARLKVAADMDAVVVFPTIVLAELLTGSPSDAAVWRIVKGLEAVDLTAAVAAQAGRLRERAEKSRRKKRDLTVDAVVAATAMAFAPSTIVTGDTEDLTLLADGYDVKVLSI